jgi:hypothetical protein
MITDPSWKSIRSCSISYLPSNLIGNSVRNPMASREAFRTGLSETVRAA